MKRKLLALTVLVVGTLASAQAQTTYTWNGSTTDYQVGTAWNPTRSVPAANDILVFDGTTFAAPNVTNLPAAETIGELRVINSANTVLAAPAASSTITVAGGASPFDFEIGAGSSLTLTASGAIVTVIQLSTGAAGSVSGNLILTGTGTTNANRILSPDIDGVSFESGSTFQWAPGGTGAGNPFGNANFGSIRFKSGSTAYQGGTTTGPSAGTGSAIQAGTLPNSVCTFDTGSLFYNWTSVHALSGRTYGDYNLDNRGGTATQTGTSAWTMNGDVVFKGTMASVVNLNLTAAPTAMVVTGNFTVEPNGRMGDTATPAAESRFEIAGNIDIAGPNASFSTNANRVWLLNGTANQTVSIPAGLSFPVLRIDKSSGDVILNSDVAVNLGLDLVSGDLDTSTSMLSVLDATPITIGAGRILGVLERSAVNGATTGPRAFPVGDNAVTIDITGAGTGTGSVSVSTTSGVASGLPGGATGVDRTWDIGVVGITGATYTVTFTYSDAELNGATEVNLVAARDTGSGWQTYPTTIDTINNTATVTGVTEFSTWTLIEAAASVHDWQTFR